MSIFCMSCLLDSWPQEILFDDERLNERMDEFYPKDEFGNNVYICVDCAIKMFQDFMELKDKDARS